MDHLATFGWTDFFAQHFEPYAEHGYQASRVLLEHKNFYRVYTAHGELLAEIAGKLRHEAQTRSDLPAVGDWVVVRTHADRAMIHAVLPRRSVFVRKSAGLRTEEQVVGTNIDAVFLVTALNQDFNLRRIERYLSVAWESGATPVIILSKADLCDDITQRLIEVHSVARGVAVHAISVVTHFGLEELASYFEQGSTVALLGSSGVGKSTLINHLIGREQQKVKEVREHDGRGRHATTHRELILLPSGGLVLDTPGMRELQLWDNQDGLNQAFEDIEAIVNQCFFADCRHEDEPRCAIRDALAEGALDAQRYESYEKLQKELKYLVRKQDVRSAILEKNKWKKLTREATRRAQHKRR
jgi:ribosome biogenesis GTPase / thiamine phosphate phosphatase